MLDTDLSGLSSPTELAFRAHWDMEGGWQDSMTTLLSLDRGTSWTLLSLPGIARQWRPLARKLVDARIWRMGGHRIQPSPAVFTSANASSAQLAFRVITDANVGYGNAGVDGWEGMAIDDLRAITYGGPEQHHRAHVDNFTTTPVLGQGVNLSQSNSTNEWVWTQTLGANGATWWNASLNRGGWCLVVGPSRWSEVKAGTSAPCPTERPPGHAHGRRANKVRALCLTGTMRQRAWPT